MRSLPCWFNNMYTVPYKSSFFDYGENEKVPDYMSRTGSVTREGITRTWGEPADD